MTSLDRTVAFKSRIEKREAAFGIIGLGYVGLPLALLFSEQRFKVTGFDVDARKVETLNRGASYIVRIPGTEIELAREKVCRAKADYSELAQL